MKTRTPKHAVVVAGAPRSGTTWVGEVLAQADHTSYVHEPDNHSLWPLALAAKAGLGRQPALDPDDEAPLHDRVWNLALSGADNLDRPAWFIRKAAMKAATPELASEILDTPTDQLSSKAARLLEALRKTPTGKIAPATGPLVVKTVHSCFGLERVAERSGGPIVVVVRNPRNGIASWLNMNWQVHRFESNPLVVDRIVNDLGVTPPPTGDHVIDTAWTYGLLDAALRKAAFSNPDWLLVEHESLSENPIEGFRDLFDKTGLAWSSAIERHIEAGDKAGDGYNTTRVRADLRHAWKTRLTEDQIAKVEQTLTQF